MNRIFLRIRRGAAVDLRSDEKGTGILEALMGIGILAVMSAGVYGSMRMSLRTTKLVEYNHIASCLASSKMEEVAAINVNFIVATSTTEANVVWPGVTETFTRVTTIVVNADNSRTVTVTVSANNPNLSTSVQFTNILALWE